MVSTKLSSSGSQERCASNRISSSLTTSMSGIGESSTSTGAEGPTLTLMRAVTGRLLPSSTVSVMTCSPAGSHAWISQSVPIGAVNWLEVHSAVTVSGMPEASGLHSHPLDIPGKDSEQSASQSPEPEAEKTIISEELVTSPSAGSSMCATGGELSTTSVIWKGADHWLTWYESSSVSLSDSVCVPADRWPVHTSRSPSSSVRSPSMLECHQAPMVSPSGSNEDVPSSQTSESEVLALRLTLNDGCGNSLISSMEKL